MHHRLWLIAGKFIPFALCFLPALLAHKKMAVPLQRRQRFVWGWCVAALGGVSCVGAFYYHYALPLFVPVCLAVAPAFATTLGRLLAAILLLIPLCQGNGADLRANRADRIALARLARLVPADAAKHCLQLFDGPPLLFLATNACPASRFAFPDHLIAAKEAGGLGIDRAAEIRRIFRRRPAAVVIAPVSYRAEPALDQLIRDGLAGAYRRGGSVPLEGRPIEVWVRR